MKTPITILVFAMLGYVHAEPSSVERDPTVLAGDWAKLTARIRTVLPSDWILETSPFQNKSLAYELFRGAGDDPMIVVYKPTPVSAVPKKGMSFVVRKEPFLLKFILEPKMPEKRWQQLNDENIRADRLTKGYEDQLSDCAKFNSKDDGPSHYEPKTEQQKTLLSEYYFVWNYARSVELPVFSFGSLSVFPHTNANYSFREKDVEAEYEQVVGKISRLMTPYNPPKVRER